MKKLFLFLTFILCVNLMWGETKTVTYTVASTTSVNKSGDVPEGSSATFENTYTTKDQLTKGNSMTLTLTGFQGLKITGLTMKMHSNKSAGTGQFSLKAGSTEIAGIASNTGFNQPLWNGAWTQEYVDIAFTLINSNYIIKENEKVVLTISASANSLFCNTITLTYEESSSTSISADNVDLDYNATSGEIDYTINNPVTGTTLSAETTTEWITNVAVNNNDNKVTFTTTANNTTSPRNGTITLSYEGANDKVVTVTQAAGPYTSIEDIFAKATEVKSTATDINITFNNWVVSGVKGSNAYVTDGANGFIVYGSGHGFEVGDKLSGTVACKVQLYNGSAELTSLTSETTGLTVTKGGTITPNTEISIADLSGVNTGTVISYSNLTYNGTAFTDGTNIIKPYTSIMSTLPTLTNGKKYNVTGVYVQFNSDKEIAPRTAEDIEEIKETEYNIAINNSIVNGAIKTNLSTAAKGVEVTITATPANGYKLSTLSVKDADENPVTVTDNKFTMPASNVTVSAEFVALAQYTITWNVNGIETTSTVTEGSGLVLPENNPSITGYTFIGWTATPITTPTNEAPTFAEAGTIVTSAMTYYAVFAIEEGDGEEAFVKVTENLSNWSGDYLIVYEDEDTPVAFKGSLTTLDATSNGIEISINNNSIVATETLKANMFSVGIKSDNVYYLKSASGQYISGTTVKAQAANGIKQDDTNEDYEITFEYAADKMNIYSKSSDQKMTLRYNSARDQMRFRFYKSGQQQIALYKYESGIEYTNYTTTIVVPQPEISLYFKGTDKTYVAGDGQTIVLNTIGTIPAEGEEYAHNKGFAHVYVTAENCEITMWDIEKFDDYCTNPFTCAEDYFIAPNGEPTIRIDYDIENTVTAVTYKAVLVLMDTNEKFYDFPIQLVVDNSKSAATSLENATISENVQKVMREGKIFIIRDGVTYSIDGRIVK